MSASSKQCLAIGMRWAARVIGASGILWYLFWLIAGLASPGFFNTYYLYGKAGIFLGAAAVAALAGFFISWWREWLAGILLIISWLPPLGLVLTGTDLGRYLILLITSFLPILGEAIIGIQFGLIYYREWLVYASAFTVAGLLFLLSWWLSRKINS